MSETEVIDVHFVSSFQREVFPKNYYVQHHFNGSTQCEDSVRKCLSDSGLCFHHSILCTKLYICLSSSTFCSFSVLHVHDVNDSLVNDSQ